MHVLRTYPVFIRHLGQCGEVTTTNSVCHVSAQLGVITRHVINNPECDQGLETSQF